MDLDEEQVYLNPLYLTAFSQYLHDDELETSPTVVTSEIVGKNIAWS